MEIRMSEDEVTEIIKEAIKTRFPSLKGNLDFIFTRYSDSQDFLEIIEMEKTENKDTVKGEVKDHD